MSVDPKTVINASLYSIFGAIVAGICGYFIGRILETGNHVYTYSKNKKKTRKNKEYAGSEPES